MKKLLIILITFQFTVSFAQDTLTPCQQELQAQLNATSLIGEFLPNCDDDSSNIDACKLIPDVGWCDGSYPKYFFNQETQKCNEFIWGGCEGVVPFHSLEECEAAACYQSSNPHIFLDLPEGWSLFGYTCIDSVDAMKGFYQIADKIEIVKNERGSVYIPSMGYNGIGYLHFSEGYQIKMIEEVTDFQFCSTIVDITVDNELVSIVAWDSGYDIGYDIGFDTGFVTGFVAGYDTALFAGFVDGFVDGYDDGYDDGADNCIITPPLKLKIGDKHAGGIVFEINENGSGLVVATEDLHNLNWDTAVSEASSYSNDGYTDWHLPSIDELNKLYDLYSNDYNYTFSFWLKQNFSVTEFDYYWTASEIPDDSNKIIGARALTFSNGSNLIFDKDNKALVRVIHAF